MFIFLNDAIAYWRFIWFVILLTRESRFRRTTEFLLRFERTALLFLAFGGTIDLLNWSNAAAGFLKGWAERSVSLKGLFLHHESWVGAFDLLGSVTFSLYAPSLIDAVLYVCKCFVKHLKWGKLSLYKLLIFKMQFERFFRFSAVRNWHHFEVVLGANFAIADTQVLWVGGELCVLPRLEETRVLNATLFLPDFILQEETLDESVEDNSQWMAV